MKKWRKFTFSVLSAFAVILPSNSTMLSFRKRSIDVKSLLCKGIYASIVILASVLSEFKNAASAA